MYIRCSGEQTLGWLVRYLEEGASLRGPLPSAVLSPKTTCVHVRCCLVQTCRAPLPLVFQGSVPALSRALA